MGYNNFFHSFSNRIDFIGGIFSFILLLIETKIINSIFLINSNIIRGLRIIRLLRVIKLLKKIKGINNLAQTLKFSLPMIMNILSLVLLSIFIYSIIGCSLFGNLSSNVKFKTLDDYINFKNFFYSFMTLVKISTNDDWAGIMYDTMKINKWSAIYFISFVVWNTFILMNLFILVLIQQFEEFHFNPENPLAHFKDELENFRKIWTFYSSKDEGFKMKSFDLISLFKNLKPPLGLYFN